MFKTAHLAHHRWIFLYRRHSHVTAIICLGLSRIAQVPQRKVMRFLVSQR